MTDQDNPETPASDVMSLIPWYVNGTLTDEEKTAIEQLLKESQAARDEHQFFQNLADNVKQEPREQVSELGWQRLQKQIRSEQQALTPQHTANPSQKAGNWWKFGVAASIVMIIGMQFTLLQQQRSNTSDIQLLSESSELNIAQWRLQIIFKEDTDWQQLSMIINDIQGDIVSGPSGLGMLRIEVAKDSSRFNNSDELIAWLRSQDTVIHVELEN